MQSKGRGCHSQLRENLLFPQIRGLSPRKSPTTRANSTRNRSIRDTFAFSNSVKSPTPALLLSPHRIFKKLHTDFRAKHHYRALSTTVSPSHSPAKPSPPNLPDSHNAIQTPSTSKDSSTALQFLIDEDLLSYYEDQLRSQQYPRSIQDGGSWAVSEYGRRSLLRIEVGREVEQPEISATPSIGRTRQAVRENAPVLKGRKANLKPAKRNIRK